MSLTELLLVIGTFGICTGVWTTLFIIIQHHKINQLDNRKIEMMEYTTSMSTLDGE